jgi:hypothetical protein
VDHDDAVLDALSALLERDGRFGHRQHLELAWEYLQAGPGAAQSMRRAIRHAASLHGEPDRYHETLTIFWVRLVALHAAATSSASFDALIGAHPGLLDTELPARHWRHDTLWGDVARRVWVEPDLVAIPHV